MTTDIRLDGPMLLQRSLEYIMPKVAEAKYPELKADMHIPLSLEGGAGSDSITQIMVDWTGRAKLTSTPGKDAPEVNLIGLAQSQVVRSLEAHYSVNFQEARSHSQAGIDVALVKAKGAKRMVMAESNRIAYLGDPASRLWGLFTFPLLPSVISPIQFNDPAVTGEMMLNYLNDWSNLVYTLTNRTFKPNAALFPNSVFQKINTTRRSGNSDTTIHDLWRASNKYIEFSDEVGEADEGGFGGTPAIIFYRRDPEHVQHFVPQPLEQLVDMDTDTRKGVLIHQREAGCFYSHLSAVLIENVLL